MDRLKTVLACLNIRRVISIDDAYASTFHGTKCTLLIDEFLEGYGVDFTEEEKGDIYDSGYSTIDDLLLSPDFSNELKTKINHTLPLFEDRTDRESLSILEDLFSTSGIDYEKKERIEDFCVSDSVDSIVFLDKEINGNNAITSFLSMLDDPFAYEENRKIIVVILTKDNLLCNDKNTWATRKQYLVSECGVDEEKAEKMAYSTLFLSKKQIVESKPSDGNGQRNNYLTESLYQSICGFCIVKVLNAYSLWAQSAYDKLIELSKSIGYDSVKTLYYNMLFEGDDNIYHSLRSVQSLLQFNFYKQNITLISPYILCMKRIARINEDECVIASNSLLNIHNQFEWAHFQFLDDTVNSTFSDVSFGDVFRLEYVSAEGSSKDFFGFLLTPPCDCIVRKSGTNASRKVERFSLLLFEEKRISKEEIIKPERLTDKAKKKWERNIKDLRNNAIIIKPYSEGNDSGFVYVDLSQHSALVEIDSFILDLTSLNADGQSIVFDDSEMKKKVASSKTLIWQSECFSFYSQLESLKQLMDDDSISTDKNEKLISKIYGVSFSIGEKRFGVSRIGKLEIGLAELMSSRFVSSAYRTGKNSLLSLCFDN